MVRYKLYEFVLSQVRKEFIVRVTKAIKAEQLALLEEHSAQMRGLTLLQNDCSLY